MMLPRLAEPHGSSHWYVTCRWLCILCKFLCLALLLLIQFELQSLPWSHINKANINDLFWCYLFATRRCFIWRAEAMI